MDFLSLLNQYNAVLSSKLLDPRFTDALRKLLRQYNDAIKSKNARAMGHVLARIKAVVDSARAYTSLIARHDGDNEYLTRVAKGMAVQASKIKNSQYLMALINKLDAGAPDAYLYKNMNNLINNYPMIRERALAQHIIPQIRSPFIIIDPSASVAKSAEHAAKEALIKREVIIKQQTAKRPATSAQQTVKRQPVKVQPSPAPAPATKGFIMPALIIASMFLLG
jgi:Zn-dependent M16 (insulinase) family peptidase